MGQAMAEVLRIGGMRRGGSSMAGSARLDVSAKPRDASCWAQNEGACHRLELTESGRLQMLAMEFHRCDAGATTTKGPSLSGTVGGGLDSVWRQVLPADLVLCHRVREGELVAIRPFFGPLDPHDASSQRRLSTEYLNDFVTASEVDAGPRPWEI